MEPEYVLKATSFALGVDEVEIKGKSRRFEVVQARHIIVAILKKKTELSLNAIGAILGGRHHTTVMASMSAFDNDLITNHRQISEKYNMINEML